MKTLKGNAYYILHFPVTAVNVLLLGAWHNRINRENTHDCVQLRINRYLLVRENYRGLCGVVHLSARVSHRDLLW